MTPRVQVIVVRDNAVLMVKHRQEGQEWWCLPGETPEQGALRELREECERISEALAEHKIKREKRLAC